MRAFVLVVATLLFVAGCLQTPPARPGDTQAPPPEPRGQTGGFPDVPAWTVNDHWVLRTYDEARPDDTLSISDPFVQAIDILRSNDADMDAFRVVSQHANSTTWYRMSDLALMKRQTFDAAGSVDTVYERPCAWYQWPLSVGETWEDDCERTIAGQSSRLAFNATVDGEETVSVPDGNFTAFRIRYTGTDGDVPIDRTEYFSMDACFMARSTETSENGTIVEELLAHQCTSSG